MVKGERIHRRLPAGSTKGDAKQLEAELRRATGKRKPAIPGDPSLDDIMAGYLAHTKSLRSPKTAVYHALRIGPWVTGRRASEAPEIAHKIIRDMREHYAAGTINKSLGTLKTALKLAYQEGITSVDYGEKIKRLPENNQRHLYLTIAQVKKLADCASEQTRAAIWIALLTGCRRGEILKLQKDDIGKKTLRIQAGNTKTLKVRTIPIVPAVRPWLKFIPLEVNFEGLKTGFRRAREKAEMPDFNFHDLRHSCASILINMGVDIVVIRDILGHSSVKTTERYSHLLVDHQAEALNKLSRAVARCKTGAKR